MSERCEVDITIDSGKRREATPYFQIGPIVGRKRARENPAEPRPAVAALSDEHGINWT